MDRRLPLLLSVVRCSLLCVCVCVCARVFARYRLTV